MTRGSRRNSKSQPTIDAAMSATPSASAADPAGSLPSRATSSQASAIVIASARDVAALDAASGASAARRRARTARTPPCRSPPSRRSVSPASGGSSLTEVQRERHGEHAGRHEKRRQIGGADVERIPPTPTRRRPCPPDGTAGTARAARATTALGVHSAPAVTSSSTTSGCCTFRRSSCAMRSARPGAIVQHEPGDEPDRQRRHPQRTRRRRRPARARPARTPRARRPTRRARTAASRSRRPRGRSPAARARRSTPRAPRHRAAPQRPTVATTIGSDVVEIGDACRDVGRPARSPDRPTSPTTPRRTGRARARTPAIGAPSGRPVARAK